MYFPNTVDSHEWLIRFLESSKLPPKIGVTSGCFDMIHPLHVQYLEKCKARCDFLIVGVDSDCLIHETKGKLPIFSEHDRAYIVAALHVVGAAFVMDSIPDLGNLLLDLTGLYRKDSDTEVELYKSQAEYYGKPVICPKDVKLVHIPDVYPTHTTTKLVQFIQNEYQKL